MAQPTHVLLLSFPAQGHINPTLQFAKRLLRMGIQVTFATTVFVQRRISKTTAAGAGKTPAGLNFVAFSDGYDDGFRPGDDVKDYMTEIRNNSSRKLRETIAVSSAEGRPVTCLVYALLLPWAAEVAREFHIPYALLWIQPATVLSIYYSYFNGYEEVIRINGDNNPSWSIKLPGLPLLAGRDLPSFLLPSGSENYAFVLPSFKEQLEMLDSETNPKVLVNTFDELEPEALKSIEKYDMVGIGPLIPSAFLGGEDPLDTCFGGDLFEKSKQYMEWLGSKDESSVVYISFGSILDLPKKQMDEIALGLLDTRRPFLWVIREKENERIEDRMGFLEGLEGQGMIVPWCSQLEVLSHPSLGCFVTHCGWNSTMESLASGVSVVAFPQWTDQGTNAKLIEDVWKTGVRVRANAEGIVEGGEVKRCIEMVMGDGERGEERRRNAKKWRDLAVEAVKDGGSSDRNLRDFLEEVRGSCK